jgi:ABC-type transporter Mla MlaB component
MPTTRIDGDFQFYMHDGTAAFSFELMGRITDRAARELKQAWNAASSAADGQSLIVDLSYVTQVDEEGRALLRDWYNGGAELVAKRPQGRSIVASITGQRFDIVSEAPRYHTWRPLHAFLGIALVALFSPAPAIASQFLL